MAKEKAVAKEFAWDTDVVIGEYGGSKERHTVHVTTLNGNRYVQDVKEVMTAKNGWKRTKGNTMKVTDLKSLYDIFSSHELNATFESSPGTARIVVADEPSKPAPCGLKAKQQARGSAPAMLGKKITVREKIEGNENFGSLSADLQKRAIEQAEAFHAEFGMVSMGISKSGFFSQSGKPQIEAEKVIKKTKGFSRSAITYIP